MGLPNVGKSSLLAAVSMAKPKIANYEFTTIHPNLGVVLVSDYEKFVVSDIPGLIKGASDGKGLGIQFLKHISRTKLLLNVVDVSNKSIDNILTDINTIHQELKSFNDDLILKDKWLVLNKIDLLDKKKLAEIMGQISDKIDHRVYTTSAIEKAGLENLCKDIYHYLKEENE